MKLNILKKLNVNFFKKLQMQHFYFNWFVIMDLSYGGVKVMKIIKRDGTFVDFEPEKIKD